MDRGFIPSFGKSEEYKNWVVAQLKEQKNTYKNLSTQSRKFQH